MFLYNYFCPKLNEKRSNEIWVCANSIPVFLKKLFVDYQRSILSAPYFGAVVGVADYSFGCLRIMCET
jgi:hypothetical protein